MRGWFIVLGLLAGAVFVAGASPAPSPSPTPTPPPPPAPPPPEPPGGYFPPGFGYALNADCGGISSLPQPLQNEVRGKIAAGLNAETRELLARGLDPICPKAAAQVRATPISTSGPAPSASPLYAMAPSLTKAAKAP